MTARRQRGLEGPVRTALEESFDIEISDEEADAVDCIEKHVQAWMTLITPSDWTLTGATREVRLLRL
jgi:hypothetical protein